jgi:hypothetical protein
MKSRFRMTPFARECCSPRGSPPTWSHARSSRVGYVRTQTAPNVNAPQPGAAREGEYAARRPCGEYSANGSPISLLCGRRRFRAAARLVQPRGPSRKSLAFFHAVPEAAAFCPDRSARGTLPQWRLVWLTFRHSALHAGRVVDQAMKNAAHNYLDSQWTIAVWGRALNLP